MNPNLSNREQAVLDELSQIELLVIKGKLSQAKAIYEAHRDIHTHASASIRAELDYYRALILHAELDFRGSLKKALSSFEYFRSTSDNKKIGRLQKLIARLHLELSELEEAEQVYHDCLATWRRIRDKTGIFDCYNRLAQIKFIRGDFEESAKYLKNAIDSFKASAREDINSEITLIRYSGNLARVYILTGEWNQAETLLRECIDHNRRNNVNDSLVRNLLSLGYLAIRRRDQRLCEDCFAEVKALLEITQLKKEEAILCEYMGEYYTEFNKYDLGFQAYQKSLKIAESLPARTVLMSQVYRGRAELHLNLADYRRAYIDALKGLEIAREVGERVEEAVCLKILALSSLRYREANDDSDYFELASSAFAGISEKFERARMHLAFSSIDIEPGDKEKAQWCRRHLKEAAHLFRKLESDYYSALAKLVDAGLAMHESDFDHAFKAVSEAEEYFDISGSDDDLGHVYGLRRRIEKGMIEFAESDENEYNLVRSIFDPNEYHVLRQADLEQNLRFLAERISADQAFVGLFDFGAGKIKPLAKYEFDSDNLEALRKIIKQSGINVDAIRPFYITAPYESSNGSAELYSDFKEVGSMILIPMDLGSQKSAIIYLQKNKGSNGCEYFSKADLNLSIAFADILAFRAMEEEKSRLEEDNFRLRTQLENNCAFPNIITCNQGMLKMLESVIQVKDSPISILIQGETGSGKDLIAKTIHYNSIRKEKRFISVNCAALPETLLESELFGYKKGAFTGADRDRAGLFEEADGGTFFLDEIGEMPLSIQAKLLRVLEDQEVVRLGDNRGHKVDVRILSATNSDLKVMMSEGRFRQDLYYRLSAMTLKIPPLRERKDDIPLLLTHFFNKYDPDVKMDADVRQIFINFAWPGNVRELDNEIKKLALLAGEHKRIDKDLLSKKFFKEQNERHEVDLPEIESFEQDFTLYDYISMFEEKYIREALLKNRWVKKHAANALGIPESTLRLKIKEYKIVKE
jgi:transcriptional regulator with GAF, ATPase, and Fis domain